MSTIKSDNIAQELERDPYLSIEANEKEKASTEMAQLAWKEQLQQLWVSKRAAAACLACSMGAVLVGYDMTMIGSIIANVEFVQQFGVYHSESETWTLPASTQLYWTVIQYVCAMAAAVTSGALNDTFGRRPVFICIVFCTFAGAIIELVAPSWKIFIIAKVLFGGAMGLMQGTIPAYVSELAPRHLRGFLLALFNFWIVLGSFIGSGVLEGTSGVEGAWSWKGAIVSQIPLGALTLTVFICLVPESPYYLVSRSRMDAARASLLRLRKNEPGYNVDEDLADVSESLSRPLQGKATKQASYLELFQGPNLRRTLIACLPMAMQHFLGFSLCGTYLPYFLSLSGVDRPFVITVISTAVSTLATLCAVALIEVVGRRPQYIFGSSSILPCLLCIGILGFIEPTSAVMTGVSALCIIWAFFWYLSVGAVGWVIAGEMATPRLRPKTVGVAAMANSLINMGWSIAIPYLVNAENANLGPKVGLVFFAPSVCFAVVAFFMIPETKGKSFQQLDQLFEARTPARRF
ncbi:uncharacterized protein DNG_09910 [Cephalotrichum gorgonifer]|uniref:Major facilitator superfamily (MFS) profile domain-containing protein n=1 Tax=Cephalotrichum gorgonifer TaxID=2041049 RepID=A0AAE8SZR0_9PEZI|nr:uncharacterized protein DNG_09910 [Cephalotrichum gorgonifer]